MAVQFDVIKQQIRDMKERMRDQIETIENMPHSAQDSLMSEFLLTFYPQINSILLDIIEVDQTSKRLLLKLYITEAEWQLRLIKEKLFPTID